MKIQFDRKLLIRIVCILFILAVLPAMPELVIFLDASMVEVLVALAALSLASNWNFIRLGFLNVKIGVKETLRGIAKLYMFKPGVFCGHAIASSVFFLVTSSVIISTLLWLPVMVVSSGTVGNFV